VTDNAIRVQLPGGDVYAPAMLQAAAKTGARSGLPTKTAKALTDLIAAGVAVMNSGDASTILLEMQVHVDTIEAKLVGTSCKSPTKKSGADLEKLADAKALSFKRTKTKSALTITFEV